MLRVVGADVWKHGWISVVTVDGWIASIDAYGTMAEDPGISYKTLIYSGVSSLSLSATSSGGTLYTVPFAVLTASGTSYTVTNSVRASDGTAYSVI